MSGTATLSYLILTLSMVYAFTIPFAKDLFTLLDEKVRLTEQLDNVHAIEDRKNTLLTEFNQISAEEIKKIETFIPSSLNYAKLVADIDSVASKYGIALDRVSYSDNSINVASVAEAQNFQGHQSSTVRLDFKATYDDFNSFMDDLERSLRILDIKLVNVVKGSTSIYNYRIEFDTYWSN